MPQRNYAAILGIWPCLFRCRRPRVKLSFAFNSFNVDATLAALCLMCSIETKEIQEKKKLKLPVWSWRNSFAELSCAGQTQTSGLENIKGFFLRVADGEAYGIDITKEKAQRKGRNWLKEKESFHLTCHPISLTFTGCSLSQITQMLFSSKPQCSH